MNKAVVLMSCYNGEKYIEEQLDSIINQDYEGEILILIRDDGSKDSTVSIIKEYQNKLRESSRSEAPNREIELHQGKNVGAARSFMRLANKCKDHNYYFFADQDDIWDSNKMSSAVAMLEGENEPVVYCSGYRVLEYKKAKDTFEITQERFVHEEGWLTPIRILYYSETLGCTMALNNKMMDIVKSYHFDRCMMHDNLIMFVASLKGKIIYDSESRLSYRIHGNNVMGLSSRKKSLNKWISEKAKILLNGEDFDYSIIAKKIIDSGIHEEFQEDAELIRDCKSSIGAKYKLLKHKAMRPHKGIRWKLSVYFHVLLNLY